MENNFILEDRLQKIRQIITQYGEDKFYLAFSGGKDSVVLSALVDMAIPNNKIPRVYINTGIEYKEMLNFIDSLKDDRLVIVKPKIPIKKMLNNEGYPFKSKYHAHFLDIYQRHNEDYLTLIGIRKYLHLEENGQNYSIERSCPKCLKYQFSPDFKLRVSDKCCIKLKEEPIIEWAKENNKSIGIIGLMRSEGGRRAKANCLAFNKKNELKAFQPLVPLTKEWEDWFIKEYNIRLCSLYYPPYNFVRTGCKGCPFAINLQHELDVLEQFFPDERKQCEIIWQPVYDEYRRINYRLKGAKNEKTKL